MDSQIKNNLTSAETWIRGLYVLLFLFCLHLASMLMLLIALAQILFHLVTGESNPWLRQLGVSLADYIKSANIFICHQSNEKPFPFADWPKRKPVLVADNEIIIDEVVVADADLVVEKVEVTEVNIQKNVIPEADAAGENASILTPDNNAIDCNSDNSHVSDKK
ncbi:MAG: DUF4389 domain-containing protein [Marinagarivorans sp.]|nr:DUF4389 domain-containing protein [Marinagarivorans sp.]